MHTHLYRKTSIITYNNKRFQVFRDEKGKYAFLELDENNKFHYPQVEDFVALANMFSRDLNKEAFFESSDNKKKNRKNKFKFTASVIAAASIIACSSLLYNELESRNLLENNNVQECISITDDEVVELPNIEEEQPIQEENPQVIEDANKTVDEESGYTQTNTIEEEQVNTSSYVKPTEVTPDMYYENPNGKDVIIKDSYALNKYLGEKQITIQDIESAINANSNIKDELKPEFIDFARQIMDTYPNVDMRLFYENIKTINIIYESPEAIAQHGSDVAWYNWGEKAIHINENSTFSPGSFDLLVLRHEESHLISIGIIETQDGKELTCVIKDNNYGKYVQEACAVMISTYPFEEEYYTTDLGYGIIANEFRVIIESIPGFDMNVLANHDIHYIEKYFDDNIDSEIKAEEFFDLVDEQTIVYYNSQLSMDPASVEKIYKYIFDAVKLRLNPNMSYEEITEFENNIIATLERNLGFTNSTTSYDTLRNEFNNYMIENNIQQQSKTK